MPHDSKRVDSRHYRQLTRVDDQNMWLATISLKPLFGWRLRRVRIPISFMTVFTGVVDGITAFQHLRGVLGVCGVKRLGRCVMQTVSKGDPRLAVLID